jgi:hypothetical protein
MPRMVAARSHPWLPVTLGSVLSIGGISRDFIWLKLSWCVSHAMLGRLTVVTNVHRRRSTDGHAPSRQRMGHARERWPA